MVAQNNDGISPNSQMIGSTKGQSLSVLVSSLSNELIQGVQVSMLVYQYKRQLLAS